MIVTEPVPDLTDEERAIVASGEILDVTVRQHERGLKYVQGRFEEILPPGRYNCRAGTSSGSTPDRRSR